MAENEKTTPEVEEVKEETVATEEVVEETVATEEVVEETEKAPVEEKAAEAPAKEAPKAEKKEKKEKKTKKEGKKSFLVPAIIAGVVVVLLLVASIVMGVLAPGMYNSKNYAGAYTTSRFALFLSGDVKDTIAREYVTQVLCPEGKYLAASKILEKTGFSTEEKNKIYATNEDLALCNKGQVVTFGKYETDNNMSNGPDPLEWIVLDVQKIDGKAYAFLMTREIVGGPGGWNRFASSEGNTSYATSNLNSWCEKDFYTTFTNQDTSLKEKIVAWNVETEDSSTGVDSGEAVVAHAYAPSIQELEQYLTGDLAKYMQASVTKSAKTDNVISYGADRLGAYYVRNIGNMEEGAQWAAGVDKEGKFQEGMGMTSASIGARVCIRVDLGEY